MRHALGLVAVGLLACGSHPTRGPGQPDGGAAPAMTCPAPLSPAPASSSTVVGTGSGTCTETLLSAAIAKGGAITFDCGGAATITVTHELALPTDRDTILDGGGKITLDGGGATRILHLPGKDYRGMYGGPQPKVTLQNLAFANGHASGTAISVPASAPADCSRGTGTDGGGGAVLIENAVLHVIDSTFSSNQAALLGPDVAGGAIYAIGSTDVTIVGSRFSGNKASNGGAVGCLNSDLTIVDDVFDGSTASGSGANSVDTSKCPASINNGQIGSGGNGGAISIDGGSDGTVTVCGCTFTHNTAGAFGGAMFRTPDNATQLMQIDLSTFDGNTAPVSGGGVMYIQNSTVHLRGSTLSNNSAVLGGAFQADHVQFTLENVTVVGNIATHSNGGAFFVSSGGGTFTNVTVANNQAQNTVEYQSFGGATFGSAFTWNNCLIDNNTDNDNNGHMACDQSGDGQHSLEWPMNSTPPCAAGITFADPMLGALGDHGGPTQTMIPAAPRSVVQIGAACPATDQTGHARGNPCTAGAYELR